MGKLLFSEEIFPCFHLNNLVQFEYCKLLREIGKNVLDKPNASNIKISPSTVLNTMFVPQSFPLSFEEWIDTGCCAR